MFLIMENELSLPQLLQSGNDRYKFSFPQIFICGNDTVTIVTINKISYLFAFLFHSIPKCFCNYQARFGHPVLFINSSNRFSLSLLSFCKAYSHGVNPRFLSVQSVSRSVQARNKKQKLVSYLKTTHFCED